MRMPAPSSEQTNLASLQARATHLLALARDPSDASRTALVSGLYDLSHASADLPEIDRALAIDLVLETMKRSPATVRGQFAEQIARDPSAPRAVVHALARDEIAVAFPILIESAALDDAELIEILKSCPPEHRLGTLQRENVSASVASAVVDTRDPQVMRWLVENPRATIPPAAMEVLVEASRAEPALQKPLTLRSDLPADLATKMCAFVPEELRERIVERHHVVPALLDQNRAGAAVGAPAGEADDKALATGLKLRASGALNAALLVKTIRAGKMTEFEALFARFSRISIAAARQVLSSPTGEGLAIALKAQGVDKSTFATILILSHKARDPGLDLSATLVRALEAFDRLNPNTAAERLAALQAAYPEAAA